jgi:hypothetical protein
VRLRREEVFRRKEELERAKVDNLKLKNIVDDQMVIAERQREKLILAKEEEANLQKDISTLHKNLMDSQEQLRLQTFQIERLRKVIKNYEKNSCAGEGGSKIK